MTLQQPKRKVGRPRRSPEGEEQRGKRRFYMLEKTNKTAVLMKMAHATHRRLTGRDGSDAEVLRAALSAFVTMEGELELFAQKIAEQPTKDDTNGST